MSDSRRKLIALDSEDLQIVSAHCQDAVLKVADLLYLPKEKRFALAMNRFVWEKGERSKERRRSVLHFERVQKVAVKNLDLKSKDQVLNMLAILTSRGDTDDAVNIEIVFSADKAIRLEAEVIEAQLSDMDAAWEAGAVPNHPEN